MQIDKIFSTQFITTENEILDSLTGVTITIIEIANDGTTANVVVNNQPCINATHGFYRYYFAGMGDKMYEYYFNPNDTRALISSGFVDKRLNNLDRSISDIRTGGGFSINLSSFNGSITNLSKLIKEENEKIKDFITIDGNDTKSKIDIAKTEILDKIESIEIPETILEEKEAKKAQKMIEKVDKKLTSYIESEMNEKEEIGAITRELKKMMEEKKKMEDEEDVKLLEEIKAEFDKQEEEDKEEKRKELEKELEETQKEVEEIKKELNSL